MLCGVQSSHAPAGQSRTEALLEAIAAYWTDIKEDDHNINGWCSNTVVEVRSL